MADAKDLAKQTSEAHEHKKQAEDIEVEREYVFITDHIERYLAPRGCDYYLVPNLSGTGYWKSLKAKLEANGFTILKIEGCAVWLTWMSKDYIKEHLGHLTRLERTER